MSSSDRRLDLDPVPQEREGQPVRRLQSGLGHPEDPRAVPGRRSEAGRDHHPRLHHGPGQRRLRRPAGRGKRARRRGPRALRTCRYRLSGAGVSLSWSRPPSRPVPTSCSRDRQHGQVHPAPAGRRIPAHRIRAGRGQRRAGPGPADRILRPGAGPGAGIPAGERLRRPAGAGGPITRPLEAAAALDQLLDTRSQVIR